MKNLLRKITEIRQYYHAEQAASIKRGEQFNMFGICGVNHYEVTHSSIIAELLNPCGSHGQGTLYLEAFLTSYPSKIEFKEEGARVLTEYATQDGRIDILITNRCGQAIIIENKIYAQDQWEQLKRYNKFAKKQYGVGNYEILYLTLHGDEPSVASAGVEYLDYRLISYSSTILEWLEDCIRLSTRIPLIRETLIQYQNHIMNLTGKCMNNQEKNEIFQTMAANAQETAAIVNASQDGYLQYVYETYVRDALNAYAAKYQLALHEHNESDINEGFYFQHQGWKKTCIKVAKEGPSHYIGISCSIDGNLEDLAKLPQQQMECFEGSPNDWWPYGWDYLNKFCDWSAASDTIPAMIDGRFVEYLSQTLKLILTKISQKNIIMI